MNHEQIRELLALRLYGEIEPDEERALVEHLRECRECARFARELEQGLGRTRELRETADLPAGWDASLADATARLRRRSWMREALLVGSGLAAGVLAMLAWSAFSSPRATVPSIASSYPDAPAFLRFQHDTPPPLATAGGPAARYLAWQAR
jgi:predicted anti-sigma-YlaC factor YlaD